MEKTVPAPVTPVNPVEPLKPGEIPVILEDEVTDEKAKPKGLNYPNTYIFSYKGKLILAEKKR